MERHVYISSHHDSLHKKSIKNTVPTLIVTFLYINYYWAELRGVLELPARYTTGRQLTVYAIKFLFGSLRLSTPLSISCWFL